jgi:Gti1/Pac2 family transcription factor
MIRKDERSDSHQPAQAQTYGNVGEQAQAGAAAAPASSGQTIPSISAMLNGGEDKQQNPRRSSSRNSGGTPPRPLQDIPSHKLGFETTRDVQALRNLDKSTFKGY